MPRKGKKKFKGIARQDLLSDRRKQPVSAATSSSKVSVTNRNATADIKLPATASQKKLENKKLVSEEECSSSMMQATERTTGYRIIDLECLSNTLAQLHMCKDGKCKHCNSCRCRQLL